MKGTMRLSTRYTIKSKAIAKKNVITTAPRIQHIAGAAPSISVGKVPINDLLITVTLINSTHLRSTIVRSPNVRSTIMRSGDGDSDLLQL